MLASAAVAVLALASPLVGGMPAHASSQTQMLSFSGSTSLQHVSGAVGCDDCWPGDNGAGARAAVDISAEWHPTASVTQNYTESIIRQGETLDLSNTLTPGAGPLTISYALHGDAGLYNFTGAGAVFPNDASRTGDTVDFDYTTSETTLCALKLNGDGNYTCGTTKSFTLYDATILGQGIKITLPIQTTLEITPTGVVTTRSVVVGSDTLVGPSPLQFNGPSPATVADPVVVPCTAPAGTSMRYDLASTTTSPHLEAVTTAKLRGELTIIFTVSTEVTLAMVGPDAADITLTAPTNQVTLGTVLADNKAPTIHAADAYAGSEGQPVQLDGSGTTDNCLDLATFVWKFSDGGVAYGVSPQHTFADNGVYSGLLRVTDGAGNAATKAFSVTVTNQAPVTNAGPDTIAAWGRDVAFNGSATDPGSADQGGLAYSWDFGDGSPSATGGPSTTHAYSTPGDYTAVLTVCDKDGACDTDARTVHVRKRTVVVGYLGDTTGTYLTVANFSASLVDEFGQAVPGRGITFNLNGGMLGAIDTNSAGTAVLSSVIGLDSGGYTASASFTGDALYAAPSVATSPFTVNRKASSLRYTGSLTGSPNKTVSLSAVLTDASGAAVAGRTVVLSLGTQSVTAVTDANGLAVASLKLSQKNGTYPLTTTWTPSGADVKRYNGSADSETFKLQAK